MKTKPATWTVGDLAKAAGTTVRTLHHYEALGLLAPRRGANNHRRYRESDVRRLQHSAQQPSDSGQLEPGAS